MLDAFADKVSKPRLYLTDKMQIALGKLWLPVIPLLTFCFITISFYKERFKILDSVFYPYKNQNRTKWEQSRGRMERLASRYNKMC